MLQKAPRWRVKLFMSEVSFRSHLALPFLGRVAKGVCRCDVLSMCEVFFMSQLALPLCGRVAEGVCRYGVLNCSCLRCPLGRT